MGQNDPHICFSSSLTIVVPGTVIPIPNPGGNVCDQRETKFLGIFSIGRQSCQ